eukprot:CAMPEP_0197846732 /NCGR_PEP_ID=MMETSP1438-20131217/4244_1 /TAXON_ID=1461541 /ORGANISM="Pterosperma sp., Strain CCMP1384" /LENGTH=77 /DNA_ID=CAMNT_0043458481 /DNA_START=93 /DNA_END=326 /DNA_ORIENTATION=+
MTWDQATSDFWKQRLNKEKKSAKAWEPQYGWMTATTGGVLQVAPLHNGLPSDVHHKHKSAMDALNNSTKSSASSSSP